MFLILNHFYIQISQITEGDSTEIELKTRGQAGNKLWKEERAKRITSSNFGSIAKATAIRDFTKLATQMVSPKEFRRRATSYGGAYESVAVERFEKLHGATEECGLYINENFPWLAASPDKSH